MTSYESSGFLPLSQTISPQLVAPVLAGALFQSFSQGILFVQLFTYVSSSRVSRPTSRNGESRWKVAYVLLVSSLAA
jgi:hypothetical protein